MNYIDIHSHIHDKAFDEDRDSVISSMKEEGFCTITIGTGKEESEKALACAKQYDHVWATVGLHPADNVLEEFDYEAYKHLGSHEKVVAVGECGLDYYYIETFFDKEKEAKGITWSKDAEVDRQKRIFEDQISLASELNKPLMLHIRDVRGVYHAYEDALHMLTAAQKSGKKVRGNVHFFAGTVDIAKQFNDIGFTVSFPGTVTFTKDYDEVVQHIPLEMMHAETDSPYATPVPYRGKRNTPLYVEHIYEKIAELKEIGKEEVRMQLIENANKMFNLTK